MQTDKSARKMSKHRCSHTEDLYVVKILHINPINVMDIFNVVKHSNSYNNDRMT